MPASVLVPVTAVTRSRLDAVWHAARALVALMACTCVARPAAVPPHDAGAAEATPDAAPGAPVPPCAGSVAAWDCTRDGQGRIRVHVPTGSAIVAYELLGATIVRGRCVRGSTLRGVPDGEVRVVLSPCNGGDACVAIVAVRCARSTP